MPDDDLRRAFADTGAWAERHTDLPGPDRARRTARRRSAAAASGAAALTVLAVVGGVVGVSRLDGPPPPVPAAPAPAVPTTAPAVPTTAPAVPTAIPDDLEVGPPLFDDGETRTEDVAELPVDVCPGEGIPGVGTATDQRFRLTTGPEYAEGDGLLVFADADAAVAFLDGLREAARRCADGASNPVGGTRSIRQEPLPGPWGEGVTLMLLNVPDPGGDFQPVVASYLLAVRTGSAVALRFSAGEYLFFEGPPAAPDPGVVAIQRRPLDALAPQLCRWTVAGC